MTKDNSRSLTDEEREWRLEFCELSSRLNKAILAIDGPYGAMSTALAAYRDLCNFAIDDEDIGPCAFCGEPIWLLANDDYAPNDDGERFCMTCVARWNETPTPAGAEPASRRGEE